MPKLLDRIIARVSFGIRRAFEATAARDARVRFNIVRFMTDWCDLIRSFTALSFLEKVGSDYLVSMSTGLLKADILDIPKLAAALNIYCDPVPSIEVLISADLSQASCVARVDLCRIGEPGLISSYISAKHTQPKAIETRNCDSPHTVRA